VWQTVSGVLLTCVVAVPACVTLLAAAVAVIQPFSVEYGESVVYGHAMRIVQGEPLYQPFDVPPYTVLNYPPLFYWLAAALQALVGPGFGSGRVLSLLAGLASAAAVGTVASRRTGQAWAGAFAGVLFLALAFPGGVPWLGVYRVDMLGVALSVTAIALLSSGTGTQASLAAGVLAGLALLTKQTFFAALIAGVLWRWPDRRQAGVFLGSALVTFGVPCVVLELTTRAFVQNTVLANVNPVDLSLGLRLLRELIALQWLPLLLAGVYLVMRRPWKDRGGRLLVLYWAASSLSVVGIVKVGANHNYWIEFAAATTILAACGAAALMHASKPLVAAAGAAGLILLVVADLGGPAGILTAARAVRSDVESLRTTTRDAEFDALVESVRREPGSVLAQPADVMVLAGRPVSFDTLIYNLLLEAGSGRVDPLVARICSGEIRLLVIDYSLEEGAGFMFGQYPLWPPRVMAALQDTMTLDRVQSGRFVYSWHPPATGAECTGRAVDEAFSCVEPCHPFRKLAGRQRIRGTTARA
jgi:MFS family permease